MVELFLYVLTGLIFVAFGWLIYLQFKIKKILAKAEILFSEDPKGNLVETLERYLKSVKEVEGHCFNLDKELKKTGKIAKDGLYKSGFVRYNPFGDVGGNQSFSLALLNGSEDGYVLSSIHSREGTRVYAKRVEKGDSTFNLSEEEKQAIEIAKK